MSKNYTEWAKKYDEQMYKLITSNENMYKEIFNIDKEGPKPRKDFAKWNDVKEKIFYLYTIMQIMGEEKVRDRFTKFISI